MKNTAYAGVSDTHHSVVRLLLLLQTSPSDQQRLDSMMYEEARERGVVGEYRTKEEWEEERNKEIMREIEGTYSREQEEIDQIR